MNSTSELPSSSAQANVASVLERAQDQLRAAAITFRLEAELLLAFVLGVSRAQLHTRPERLLSAHQLERYQRLIGRRIQKVPLAYLTGQREFYGLDFKVNPYVLIPRPETETLVDLARAVAADLARHKNHLSALNTITAREKLDYTGFSIADVGTGSGCIAIALATHLPDAHIFALDLSQDALQVAHANAIRHQVLDRITFVLSDVLKGLPERVHMIVSNPPYITTDEWSALPNEIREHEPRIALQGGPDGLDIVYKILKQAPSYLCSTGVILIEIGAAQGPAATALAKEIFPQATLAIHKDLSGQDRVLGVLPHPSRKSHHAH
jgi:release factor glutamine methyltransferase